MQKQEFKEQDKVIDLIKGKTGIIFKISHEPIEELIVVMDGIDSRYDLDGRYNDTDKYPRLAHLRTDYDYSKIDFNNLPQREVNNEDIVKKMNKEENNKIMLGIFKDIAYTDVKETDLIDSDLNFDEVDRVELVMALEKKFNIIINDNITFNSTRVQDIIDFVNSKVL